MKSACERVSDLSIVSVGFYISILSSHSYSYKFTSQTFAQLNKSSQDLGPVTLCIGFTSKKLRITNSSGPKRNSTQAPIQQNWGTLISTSQNGGLSGKTGYLPSLAMTFSSHAQTSKSAAKTMMIFI